MDIKEEIHALSEEMLTNLGRLVAIDSQLGTPSEGKPFGEGPAKALEEGLKIAEELGFKTVNLDNYCGYAEMGEGDEIVGIAGHLDIVPVGGDWTYDPFRLTREDDHVYGRGTTDDKGPILEALYAMKLLRDHGVKLNKRVRLIMGCNEETGSRCMDHYNQVAEELSCGFTPDASFPCIHGEKGQLAMIACSKNTRIISMNGGFVSNAMCDTCTTVVPDEDGLKEKLESALSRTKLQEYKVTEENGELTIYAKGIPAHASTPHLGVNAAGVTFECLAKAGFEDDFVEFYNSHIGTACDGSGIGLKFADEYGDLTLCNGIVKTENGVISCTIDIRVPVTLNETDIRKMCQDRLEDKNGRMDVRRVETLKQGGEMVGNHTRVKVVKNKVAPPFKQAEFDIMFGTGISREGDILDLAAECSIVNKSGAWYAYEGDKIGQGRENAKLFLREHPEIRDEIEKKVRVHYHLDPADETTEAAVQAEDTEKEE